MNDEDKRKLIESYNKSLETYGYDPRSLQVKDRQELRYRILSEIGNLSDCSILDVGCGFGDFGEFLVKRGMKVRYTGFDINPNLVRVGRQAHPNARLEVRDIETDKMDERFDWVFESGIFNNKISDNEAWVKNMLRKMFELCDKGVAANFMSSYVDFKMDYSHHASPEEIFSYCKTLSRRVLLRHDYMPFEFAVYVYKDDRISEDNVFIGWSEMTHHAPGKQHEH
jgi:trans-aconitate methyltransferase